MKIINRLLSYNKFLEKRDTATIDKIVLHCTELPTLTQARKAAEKVYREGKKTWGNSGHFYIDKDGQVYRFIDENRVTHHVFSHNRNSIGIEIINAGRYPNWHSSKSQVPTEEYTEAQISSLLELLVFLKKRLPNISMINKHSDLDRRMVHASDDPSVKVHRKIDPGPLFPWRFIKKQWEEINIIHKKNVILENHK